ncbi:MAG TPA: FxSxx-COOH system tetratricopeptide repeat protein, partial [Ktedonobacteraceae bacterium]
MGSKQENQKAVSVGQHIVQARRRLHLSQSVLAEMVGASVRSIKRWEQDQVLPQLFYREALCRILQLDGEEIFGVVANVAEVAMALPRAMPHLWHVPYQRNLLFTGRATILQSIHEFFKRQDTSATLTQSYALSGLGGIGKTQIALEYVYRYATEYTTIFWLDAETYETLLASFTVLAEILDLAEQVEQDHQRLRRAVLDWLRVQSGWLLVFDNVEDANLLKRFLPTSHGGALLLTTRLQALGTSAQQISVESMTVEEGMAFLAQRTRVLKSGVAGKAFSSVDSLAGQAIVIALDGLPLALDQAGAYIEETQHSLQDYLHWYHQRRSMVLARRGQNHYEHPASVATTFSLSFQLVEQKSPLAADILRVCAFLAPDAIPEELFMRSALHLGQHLPVLGTDPWLLDEAIGVLRMYSLVRRDSATHTLSMHRLVQVVLLDSLSKQELLQWTENVIQAIDQMLPDDQQTILTQEQQSWYSKLLPHALACLALNEQATGSFSPRSSSLLVKVANHLRDQARFEDAEPLYKSALALYEQDFGPCHIQMGEKLSELAQLYGLWGKYPEAERLFLRSLVIFAQPSGQSHLNIAHNLNELALVYGRQGKYEEAEPLFLRSLILCEQELGSPQPLISVVLNNLAVLYQHQGKYEKAEPLLLRVLDIREQILGPDHHRTAVTLNYLAVHYIFYQRYAEAEPLLLRTLAIREQELGLTHPSVAISLNDLGQVYREQGRYAEAERLLLRALAIREQRLGLHPLTARTLTILGGLYVQQKKYAEAGQRYQQALAILEKPGHPDAADTLQGLANLYQALGQPETAVAFYEDALAICERFLGPEHPKTMELRTHYR